MKSSISTPPEHFQPYTLHINIENELDNKLLKAIFYANIHIPNLLTDDGSILPEEYDQLKAFMSNIVNTIRNK